jgi:hypothetical protein
MRPAAQKRIQALMAQGFHMQTATVHRIHRARATGFDAEGEEIVKDAPVSVGRKALVTRAGGHRFFFGWRSDLVRENINEAIIV